MNTAIRKLPQGLGAGFAESMPARSAKHVELMRLLDSQVDEHLGWSSDEPPVPSRPDPADPEPPAEPARDDDSSPTPTEWPDTVLDPSSAIDVAFTEHGVAPASAPAPVPAPAPHARRAWQGMKTKLPWVMLFFASIPVTVWLTLQWSNPAPSAAAAVVDKPQAEPATKLAQTPMAAVPQANPAPAQPAASAVPVMASAQTSPATAPSDTPATPPQPIDTAACAESRAALGLCSTPNGPSTTSPGVKP